MKTYTAEELDGSVFIIGDTKYLISRLDKCDDVNFKVTWGKDYEVGNARYTITSINRNINSGDWKLLKERVHRPNSISTDLFIKLL